MRASLVIAINNIKKKKLQSVLILIIIIITAILFITSLNTILSIDKPFAETHNNLHGFDNLFRIDPKKEKFNEIEDFFKTNNEVSEIEINNVYTTGSSAKVNGKKMKQNYSIQEKKDKDIGIDRLKIVEGEEKNCPKADEVWLSKDMAKDNGISLGDEVEFSIGGKVIQRKIGALVVDPSFGKAGIGICRFWIREGELENIVPSGNVVKSIAIRFKNCGDGDKVNLELEKKLGRPVLGYELKYSLIEAGYTIEYKLIGEFIGAIALLILIFTLIVIIMTISNSIFSECKNIGIISSLGFTKFQVVMNYIMQFSILATVGIGIGIIFGNIASTKLIEEFYESLGFTQVNLPLLKVSVITFLVIVVSIILIVAITSVATLRISVVEALKQEGGGSSKDVKNRVSILNMKRFNISLSVAVKSILGNLRQSFLLLTVISVAMFVIIFSINSKQVLNKIQEFGEAWGFNKSDISISYESNKDVTEIKKITDDLKSKENVKSVTNMYPYAYIVIPKTEDMPSKSIYTLIYDEELSLIGLENIKGSNPKADDELTLSKKLSEKYKKDVGDYITLYINGEEEKFLITGIFQSVIHNGEGLRINKSVIDKVDKNLKNTMPYEINITVKDKSKIDSIIKDLKDKYGDRYRIEKGNIYVTDMIKNNFGSVNIAFDMIIISFMVLSIVCIFNLNLINIYLYKKDFGIYKALGFTNNQIVIAYLYKIIFIIILSLVITIPITQMIEPSIFSLIVKSIGIEHMPVNMYYKEIFSILTIFIIAILITVLISCRGVSKINSRELISE